MEDYLIFHGTPSVLFEQLEAGNEEGVRHLEIVREYGSHQKLEDGTELPLFQWEDGYRKLGRATDGSLFLIQTSVIYQEEMEEEERDWYQVDSEEQAEWLNRHIDGQKLAYHYNGPKIWTAEGVIHFSRG